MSAGKLSDLVQRAGRWLGLAQDPPQLHTSSVVSDRFDAMTWRDTFDQARALGELAEDLGEHHHYTGDLLSDAFLAAYKASPTLRERQEMDPSRLVNHQVIDSLMTSPEFVELRRETMGDPYAAAMAVLAQGRGMRTILERAEQAQAAADQARKRAEQCRDAAAQVEAALQRAVENAAQAAGDEGADQPSNADQPVSAEDEQAVLDAIENAERAEAAARSAADGAARALSIAAPAIRTASRAAVAKAAGQAAETAALMRAWGVEPGQLQRMSFTERTHLATRLRGSRLGRFAELIGRFRRMASGERARRIEHAPGELVGITLGDDLSRLIPSELVNVGIPALRPVFATKYAEAALMIYDSRGEESSGQGAIVACVDCSGSMATPISTDGTTGEAWAKACALALLDQAREAKRDFVGILFSSKREVRLFRFPASQPADISQVVTFAEHFFNGGTDYEAPLSAATEVLREQYSREGQQRGDIVFITDGEAKVSETWMRGWLEAKEALEFRTFGIAIGTDVALARATQALGVLDALCDNLRTVTDLTDTHVAAELFRLV